MNRFFWKRHSFWSDFKNEVETNQLQKINISSAYLSVSSVYYLKTLLELTDLKKENLCVFTSIEFNESQPAEILKEISELANVFIVAESFLHSKIYEVAMENKVIFYNGSANMTDGGLAENIECMSKTILENSPVSDLWKHLFKNSVKVNDEIIEIYKSTQKSLSLIPKKSENTLKSKIEEYNTLKTVFEKKEVADFSDKLTSRDIAKYLMFLNNRILKSGESLSFLKGIDGYLYEKDIKKPGKTTYTISKEDFWMHLISIPRFKRFLEKREINTLQQLSDRADMYYVEFFYE